MTATGRHSLHQCFFNIKAEANKQAMTRNCVCASSDFCPNYMYSFNKSTDLQVPGSTYNNHTSPELDKDREYIYTINIKRRPFLERKSHLSLMR